MANRALKFCAWSGCSELVSGDRYCQEHSKRSQRQADERRGSANERGYTSRWNRYSKAFLKKPENQICKLQLHGCTIVSKCVDHIIPPKGANDPLFWDKSNHQAACIHCNSVKGNRMLEGKENEKIY
jgi:5-methylcytosine-specific restriction protein A